MECPRCDLKKHRACTCGRVKLARSEKGALVSRHIGKEMTCLTPIIIGTECSGIEAPINALRRMGIAHHHAYSTECNESAQVWSMYNCCPHVRHKDIMTRDPYALPKVDIYICGIPCQEFSRMNQHKKSNEELECTNIVMRVIEAIASHSRRCRYCLLRAPTPRCHSTSFLLVPVQPVVSLRWTRRQGR